MRGAVRLHVVGPVVGDRAPRPAAIRQHLDRVTGEPAWRRPTEREVLLWRLPVHQQQPHQARSTSGMITRPTARGHRPTRADPTARGVPVWLRTWWTALSLLEHIRYGSVTECLVRRPG